MRPSRVIKAAAYATAGTCLLSGVAFATSGDGTAPSAFSEVLIPPPDADLIDPRTGQLRPESSLAQERAQADKDFRALKAAHLTKAKSFDKKALAIARKDDRLADLLKTAGEPAVVMGVTASDGTVVGARMEVPVDSPKFRLDLRTVAAEAGNVVAVVEALNVRLIEVSVDTEAATVTDIRILEAEAWRMLDETGSVLSKDDLIKAAKAKHAEEGGH